MAADLTVANEALIEIGEAKVTQSDLDNGANNRAIVLNQLYDATLDEILSSTFWKFALKYHALAKSSPQPLFIPGGFAAAFDLPNDFIRPIRLDDDDEFELYSHFSSIADGPNRLTSSGITVTSTAHGVGVGSYVYLDEGKQKGEIRRVVGVVDANTFTIEAPFTMDQAVSVAWKKASGSKTYLITNAGTPKLEYVARVPVPSLWDPLFRNAFVKRLASKLALSLAHSRTLSTSLFQEYLDLLARAEVVSGQSAHRPKKLESRELINVRRGG